MSRAVSLVSLFSVLTCSTHTQTRGVYITMTASDIDGDEGEESEMEEMDEEGTRDGPTQGEVTAGVQGNGVAMVSLATDGKPQMGYGTLV